MDLDRIRELIIGFALVALIAAAGAIALDDFKSDIKLDNTNSISNESVTISSGTGTLDQAGEMYITFSACRNASMVSIPIAGDFCNVTGTGEVSVNPANFSGNLAYIDYTHYAWTHGVNITQSGLIGIDNTTSYFGTAGTIAGVALLLTIVIGAFYFVTRRTET